VNHLTVEAVPTFSLPRVIFRGYFWYKPLNWAFISFQKNRIEHAKRKRCLRMRAHGCTYQCATGPAGLKMIIVGSIICITVHEKCMQPMKRNKHWGLQCPNLDGNQTANDKYWQNNKVLFLAKCMKLCTFLSVCIESLQYTKICKNWKFFCFS